MTELTFVIYPDSKERSIRVKEIDSEWTEREIVDSIIAESRRHGWQSSGIIAYRQTPSGWRMPWAKIDTATGDYRRIER